MTPPARLRPLNDAPVRPDGDYVLYWMTSNRRTGWNFALDRAAERGRELGRPLLVFEPLRAGYPWASDRLHRFVLDGMADNRSACEAAGVAYYPYVEPEPDRGKGLLAALAGAACVVVADDHPGFFYPAMLAAAGRQLPVRLEAVDSCGLLPLAAAERTFARAYDFRRFLQRHLPRHLDPLPDPEPLAGAAALGRARVPAAVGARWPSASAALIEGRPEALAALPIDHAVPAARPRGGSVAGTKALERFVEGRLARYGELRNHPDEGATSGLSPYLHFGHVSAHRVFAAVAVAEGWSEGMLSRRATGSRSGWWGMGASAEAFLDQLVTWRELGFNGVAREGPGWAGYDALPPWARATLEAHAADRREHRYSADELDRAATHDRVWNAAQTELRREGRLHNYLRMLWGKKVLEWTGSPREALDVLYAFNDRYALDGRDPNSVSGITWCLGRYDRAWGPERPVFGKIRYMSSANTARKVRLARYLERYAPPAG